MSHESDVETMTVLLGVTGSVAAVKAPEIALRLVQEDLAVKILLTKGGRHFWDQSRNYSPSVWEAFEKELRRTHGEGSSRIEVIDASDEWREWKVLGDPVMHIRLRSWADLLLVAPLSAHSLAKFRHGLCDDALSSVLRAWNFHKPIILAPAMNTAMWDHPLTREQLEAIQKFSPQPETVTVVDPTVKTLACGDVGKGALAPVDDIIAQVQKVVITLASAKRQKVQLS